MVAHTLSAQVGFTVINYWARAGVFWRSSTAGARQALEIATVAGKG